MLALVSWLILVILALLVRSLTEPLSLRATIALSTGTAIGLTTLAHHALLGQPLCSIMPVFAFVFLVALGQDFNILTMSRIREEVRKLGQRRGIGAAVALTGEPHAAAVPPGGAIRGLVAAAAGALLIVEQPQASLWGDTAPLAPVAHDLRQWLGWRVVRSA